VTEVSEQVRHSDPGVRLRPWLAAVVVVAVSGLALVLALTLGGGAWRAPPEGLPDAGVAVGWALPIARWAALTLAVLTVAGLLYAGVLGPQGRDGVLSRQGRAAVLRAGWASLAWAGMAVLLAVLTLASVLALPLAEALSPSIVLAYAWELDSSRTLVLTAIVAGLIGIGALFTTTVTATVGWLVAALLAVAFPALSGHAAGLGDHALAITSSVLHQVAATLWVAGVVAVLGAAWRRDPQLQRTASGFSTLALWTVAVLVLSGVLSAMTRMDEPGQLLSTGYGLVLTAKIVVLGVLLALAARLRQRLVPRVEESRGAFVQLVVLEVALLAVAMGLAVSLARTPAPRSSIDLLTPGEQLVRARVWGGEQGTVQLVAQESIRARLTDAERSGARVVVDYRGPLVAPVAKARQAGAARLLVGGVEIASVPVYPRADVPARPGALRRSFDTLAFWMFGG